MRPDPQGGWVSFASGQIVRCPGRLRSRAGSMRGVGVTRCNYRIGDVLAAVVRVRVLQREPANGGPALIHKCAQCGELLEIHME
jgi:hypothetical protein